MTVCLTGVRQRYRLGGPWVLDGVDLDVPPGILTWVQGANGSGKSTLLRLIAGVGQPVQGQITGRPVTGFVPERFSPAPPMRPLEYLVHLGRARKMDPAVVDRRGRELLDRLGARDLMDTRLSELSKGSAQKVVIAQALLPEPDLLVLDEAWTSLDADARKVLDAMIDDRLAAGAAVVFVDHELTRLAGRPMRRHGLDGGKLITLPDTLERSAPPGAEPRGGLESGPAVLEIVLSSVPVIDLDAARAVLELPDDVHLAAPAHGVVRVQVPAEASDPLLRRALDEWPGVHVQAVRPARAR